MLVPGPVFRAPSRARQLRCTGNVHHKARRHEAAQEASEPVSVYAGHLAFVRLSAFASLWQGYRGISPPGTKTRSGTKKHWCTHRPFVRLCAFASLWQGYRGDLATKHEDTKRHEEAYVHPSALCASWCLRVFVAAVPRCPPSARESLLRALMEYGIILVVKAHSSSGLGRGPLKAEIRGSNPLCATMQKAEAPP